MRNCTEATPAPSSPSTSGGRTTLRVDSQTGPSGRHGLATDTQEKQRWLPLPAAASHLGVPDETLREWAGDGRVRRFTRQGGEPWFRHDDLERLAAAGAAVAGPPSPLPASGRDAGEPEELEQRLRAGLVELGALVSRTLDLDELLRAVAARLRAVTDTACCDVYMLRDERLFCVASEDPQGFDEEAVGVPLPQDDFPMTWLAIDEGQPVAIDSRDDARLSDAERADMTVWGWHSEVVVPLLAGERIVGVVNLLDIEPRTFDDYLEFLHSVAGIIAGAFEKAALVERLEERNRDLRQLVEAGLELGTTLALDDVIDMMARRMRAVTGATFCDVYLVEGPLLRGLYSLSDKGIDADFPGRTYPLSDFPTSRTAVETGEPVAMEDIESDPRTSDAERAEWLYWGIRAGLVMPLVAGARVVGVTALFSDRTQRFQSPDLLRGLNQIAAQAIANAELFRRQERHTRQLTSILDAGRAITSTLVVEEVLATVARRAAEALDCHECVIWEYEPADDAIVSRSFFEREQTGYEGLGVSVSLAEQPVYRLLLESDGAVEETISDAGIHPESRESMEKWGEKTCLTVPIVFGGEPLGLLVLIETETERHFAKEEVALVTGLAEHAATAIHNARTFRRLDEQNRRLASLLDSSRTITSSLVLEEVLARVAGAAAKALQTRECLIYEYDRETDAIIMRTCYEDGGISAVVDADTAYPLAEWPRDREVLERGEPVQDFISDPGLDQATRASMERWGEKSCLNVPFSFGDEPMGMLILIDTQSERRFDVGEIELARGLGEQAATAVHNAQLYRRLEDRQRETELLNQIVRKITATLRTEEIAAGALAELRKLAPFDGATLVLVGEDGAVSTVYDTDDMSDFDTLRAGDLPGGFMARLSRERVVFLRIPEDSPLPPDHPVTRGLGSAVAIALLDDQGLIGALTLGSRRKDGFPERLRDLLDRLGTHLALALTNAALYESIRRLHLGNLKALSSALSAKDYYTLGHAARVAGYIVLLGQELGWPVEVIRQVEEAAYLHDIGKIAISDRVLLKPSRLSQSEWELMRQHPSVSAEIIGALFPDEPVVGVRHHHERYDGSGYPDGLAGDRIPALAQAMGIVDAYDAMSSWRPYRAAMDYEACLAELDRCSGTQFDPQIVATFKRVLVKIAERRRLASAAAEQAAARLDGPRMVALLVSGDESQEDYAAAAAVLREVRDANPPTRFLVTIAPGDAGFVVVVDPEEDPEFHSSLGQSVVIDDALPAFFAGEEGDANILYVDEWGIWISSLAALRDDEGAIVAAVAADLPIADDIQFDGLRGRISETLATLVHSAALRFTRAEIDAVTDGLTGVFNHRYLHERLAQEIEAADDAGTRLTLLFCDLDHFKEFNDRYGHSAGDAALRTVAQIIESSIRHVDVAARYGGEEFVVILVDTDADAAVLVAERIRDRVARARVTDAGPLTVSIGLATYPVDSDTPGVLIDQADGAMYRAKREGRDRARRYDGHDAAGRV